MQPIQCGDHVGVGIDLEVLALADAAFLSGAEPEQIASRRAADHPLEPMGDTVAVLVGRALEGFRGCDFLAGFEVEDFLSGQRGIEGVGPMNADAGLGRVPVACRIGFKFQSGGRGQQFKTIMCIVKLRRGGGENEFEIFVRGDDRQESGHEFAEVADESDFIEQDGSRPRAGGGDIGRNDLGAGETGGRVINAKFEALLAEEAGEIGEAVFFNLAVILAVEGFKLELWLRGQKG